MSKETKKEGCEGTEAALDGELSEAQLHHVTGGVVTPPNPIKKLPPTTTVGWSGEPYRPVEDVEAY